MPAKSIAATIVKFQTDQGLTPNAALAKPRQHSLDAAHGRLQCLSASPQKHRIHETPSTIPLPPNTAPCCQDPRTQRSLHSTISNNKLHMKPQIHVTKHKTQTLKLRQFTQLPPKPKIRSGQCTRNIPMRSWGWIPAAAMRLAKTARISSWGCWWAGCGDGATISSPSVDDNTMLSPFLPSLHFSPLHFSQSKYAMTTRCQWNTSLESAPKQTLNPPPMHEVFLSVFLFALGLCFMFFNGKSFLMVFLSFILTYSL